MFGIFSATANPRPYAPPPSSRVLTPADRQRLEALRPGAAVAGPISAPAAGQVGR
jgi:hypothetical protein